MNINAIIELSGKTRNWALGFTFSTEKEALEAVKQDGDALRYVKDQSEAVCLEAVKQDGHALQYVDFTKETDSTEEK